MQLQVEYVDISTIKPYKGNAKEHPKEQIEQIKKSMQEFGNIDPIGIWHNEIVEGHGRYLALKELGETQVPVIRLDDLTDEQRRMDGFAQYFVDHTQSVYPQAAAGVPWSAAMMQVKGDPITDLAEDMGAEQKARTTYDNILRLSDDPDVNDVIKFLRAREVVHFQRFGEAMEKLREKLNERNIYYMNPALKG
jgi:hypothetical protein